MQQASQQRLEHWLQNRADVVCDAVVTILMGSDSTL
jgi:hypothetical protein